MTDIGLKLISEPSIYVGLRRAGSDITECQISHWKFYWFPISESWKSMSNFLVSMSVSVPWLWLSPSPWPCPCPWPCAMSHIHGHANAHATWCEYGYGLGHWEWTIGYQTKENQRTECQWISLPLGICRQGSFFVFVHVQSFNFLKTIKQLNKNVLRETSTYEISSLYLSCGSLPQGQKCRLCEKSLYVLWEIPVESFCRPRMQIP